MKLCRGIVVIFPSVGMFRPDESNQSNAFTVAGKNMLLMGELTSLVS